VARQSQTEAIRRLAQPQAQVAVEVEFLALVRLAVLVAAGLR